MNELSLFLLERTTDDNRKIWAAGIRIDGRDFIKLISEIEQPFAYAEGHSMLAGSYSNVHAADLFGSPTPLLKEDETTLLDCSCDTAGCWPLRAMISFNPETVIWSGFNQPHRDEEATVPWKYGDLKFVFDRRRYLEEIRRIQDEIRGFRG